MPLTKSQYKTLERKNNSEKKFSSNQESKIVFSTYFRQADQLLRLVGSFSGSLNRALATEILVQTEVLLPQLNAEIYPDVFEGQLTLAGLSIAQQNELMSLANLNFSLSSGFSDTVVRSIQNIDDFGFKLSGAIWAEDGKDTVYKSVLSTLKTGGTVKDLEKLLEASLTSTKPGGQFYNVRRVIDTEFQRAYFTTTVEGSREFNKTSDDPLVYVRSLSPAHKIADICDSVQGVYDLSGLVPEIPSHPNCMCIISRMFLSDTNFTLKDLTFTGNTYISEDYPKQSNRMI